VFVAAAAEQPSAARDPTEPTAAPYSSTSESDEDQEVSNSYGSQGPADEHGGAWKHVLWEALHSTALRSSFACSGRLYPNLLPTVTVAGVGRLKLPLSKKQAASLKTVAEQAPHGTPRQGAEDRGGHNSQGCALEYSNVTPHGGANLSEYVTASDDAEDIGSVANVVAPCGIDKLHIGVTVLADIGSTHQCGPSDVLWTTADRHLQAAAWYNQACMHTSAAVQDTWTLAWGN